MLIEHAGGKPSVAGSAYVAPTAVVCGDVRIGENSRVLFGAVIVAEGGPVEIGAHCIIMENAVLRGRPRHSLCLGNRVLVGPHAHLNGVVVDDEVFIATGVSAFPGARIESGCEVRINSVIHVNSRLTANTTVPIGWIAVGNPAELFEPSRLDDYWPKLEALDFPRTLVDIPREELTMAKLTSIYAELFGGHRGDRVIG
jgi:gamma-carbonic anhydrase